MTVLHRQGPNVRRAPGLALGLAVALAGCAAWPPGALPPGTPIATARQGFASPTGEYRLPGGGTRLEYAQGAFGKQTFMLDFDSAGLLVANTQVLTEAHLATIAPGLSAADLRMQFGRPANVFSVPWQKLHVWSYRYFTGDCVWYQVSISDASQQVTEAGVGTDPACDAKSSRD